MYCNNWWHLWKKNPWATSLFLEKRKRAVFPKKFCNISLEVLIDFKLSRLIPYTFGNSKDVSLEKLPMKPWALLLSSILLECVHIDHIAIVQIYNKYIMDFLQMLLFAILFKFFYFLLKFFYVNFVTVRMFLLLQYYRFFPLFMEVCQIVLLCNIFCLSHTYVLFSSVSTHSSTLKKFSEKPHI